MNNSSEGLCKKSWEPETTFNQQGFGKKIYLMLGNPVFLKKIRFRKVEISDDEKSCVCRKIASHTQQSVTGGAGTKQLSTPTKPHTTLSFGKCFIFLKMNQYLVTILGSRSMRHSMVEQTFRLYTTCTIDLKAPLDRNFQQGANLR